MAHPAPNLGSGAHAGGLCRQRGHAAGDVRSFFARVGAPGSVSPEIADRREIDHGKGQSPQTGRSLPHDKTCESCTAARHFLLEEHKAEPVSEAEPVADATHASEDIERSFHLASPIPA